ENVSSIARKLDISVERLCNANNISRSTRLRPSQILRY
ncbi:MAG: LysM peptidoglycan-binding domain-containing protein, partial [Alloprevotella sp.]|nr:LysM peptidoglycan-binding domain-containing protein [Alloprevotella sp.]